MSKVPTFPESHTKLDVLLGKADDLGSAGEAFQYVLKELDQKQWPELYSHLQELNKFSVKDSTKDPAHKSTTQKPSKAEVKRNAAEGRFRELLHQGLKKLAPLKQNRAAISCLGACAHMVYVAKFLTDKEQQDLKHPNDPKVAQLMQKVVNVVDLSPNYILLPCSTCPKDAVETVYVAREFKDHIWFLCENCSYNCSQGHCSTCTAWVSSNDHKFSPTPFQEVIVCSAKCLPLGLVDTSFDL